MGLESRWVFAGYSAWLWLGLNFMRVVGGDFKGRILQAPRGMQTRPTTDQFRESLFNILLHGLGHELGNVLDLFAGSGALSIEAFSRGAKSSVLIEEHPQTLKILHQNLTSFQLQPQSVVHSSGQIGKWRSQLLKLPSHFRPFHTIFSDPPYDRGLTEKTFRALQSKDAEMDLFAPTALWIAETSRREKLDVSMYGWELIDERSRSDTSLSFFRRKAL